MHDRFVGEERCEQLALPVAGRHASTDGRLGPQRARPLAPSGFSHRRRSVHVVSQLLEPHGRPDAQVAVVTTFDPAQLECLQIHDVDRPKALGADHLGPAPDDHRPGVLKEREGIPERLRTSVGRNRRHERERAPPGPQAGRAESPVAPANLCPASDRGSWAVYLRVVRLTCSRAASIPVARAGAALVALALVVTAGCSSTPARTTTQPQRPVLWVDEPVSFVSGGLKIYGTFRHPVGDPHATPGALLIAGSGPTDRNGNSPAISGSVNTLQTLADWLSADGVASLRYDKLASGVTGLGSYSKDPASIGLGVFEQEAVSALRWLARQRGIATTKLAVVGHSEGALFALLLAAGAAGRVPPIHALALLEPLSERYLDVITAQTLNDVRAQQRSGLISATIAAAAEKALADAVASLRATGRVAATLPYGLSGILSTTAAKYLRQADRYDPAALAKRLRPDTPVLVSCSNDDIQVTCSEVDHLLGGLRQGSAEIDFVRLTDVDHVLKVDPSLSTENYGQPLPFSPQLEAALRSFVSKYL
jgi:alpha-beta hydrolase superfamily lysophospholipase